MYGKQKGIKTMRNWYSLESCSNLMNIYFSKGGNCITVHEGNLGLGTVVCYGNNLKTSIIQEQFVNSWSSIHTIRMYKKMPKKYEKLINKVL